MYLPKLLELNDIDFTVGVLYQGGQSLLGHCKNFDNISSYTYYEYSKSKGYWTIGSASIQSALKLRNWTDVVLHEVSHASYDLSYVNASLQPLIDKIRAHVSYDFNVDYMLTPAYGISNSGYFEEMYDQINDVG